MKKLNDVQVGILLDLFPYMSGVSRHIAVTLLTEGTCIVAGTKPLWRGGVGNFIRVEDAGNGFVECSKYTLDLAGFLSSIYVKEFLLNKSVDIQDQLKTLRLQELELLDEKSSINELLES